MSLDEYGIIPECEIARADELTRLRAAVGAMRKVSLRTLAHLVVAVSLLEGGGKKAAASDKIFYLLIDDCNATIDAARAALAKEPK